MSHMLHKMHAVDVPVVTAREIVKKLSPSPRIAAPRARTRKAESAACLTSSPDKRGLVEKADDKKGRRQKPRKRNAPGKKRKTKKQATPESSDDEDKTWPCLVCGEKNGSSVKCASNGPTSSAYQATRAVHTRLHEQCTPGYTSSAHQATRAVHTRLQQVHLSQL